MSGLIKRIEQLAGADVARQIHTEFAGDSTYIPISYEAATDHSQPPGRARSSVSYSAGIRSASIACA